MTPDAVARFLAAVRRGLTPRAAAVHARGLAPAAAPPGVVNAFKALRGRDPVFRAAWRAVAALPPGRAR